MDNHYFGFEKDFVEDGLRCIPMVVRMKLDAVGIKMSLRQWSQLGEYQRVKLATMPVKTKTNREDYSAYLCSGIAATCDEPVVRMAIPPFAEWKDKDCIPTGLQEQAAKFKMPLLPEAWKNLRPLQRYALVKLSRPGHENRNFPFAMAEFGLTTKKEGLCAEPI